MENNYVYTKKRSEFGRQCIFSDDFPKLVDNLLPNKEHSDEYIRQNPVHRSTQCSKTYAENEVPVPFINEFSKFLM